MILKNCKKLFFTSNLEVIKSWDFITSKLLVKKELFTIFQNQFQITLETLLWHIMPCCGYVTCSPWSQQYVENIFGPTTCIKIFFRGKTRRDGSFCNLILTPKGVCRYQKCCKKCWFSWFFELQRTLENFLLVYNTCYGYVKHPSKSGEYSARQIMFIRHTKPKIQSISTFYPPQRRVFK